MGVSVPSGGDKSQSNFAGNDVVKLIVSVPSGGDKSQRAGLGGLDIIGLVYHFATEMGKYIHLDKNYTVKML